MESLTHMTKKILKEDQNLHSFVVIVVRTDSGLTKGRYFKRPQREQQQKS